MTHVMTHVGWDGTEAEYVCLDCAHRRYVSHVTGRMRTVEVGDAAALHSGSTVQGLQVTGEVGP